MLVEKTQVEHAKFPASVANQAPQTHVERHAHDVIVEFHRFLLLVTTKEQ